jgi:hypothetical protein
MRANSGVTTSDPGIDVSALDCVASGLTLATGIGWATTVCTLGALDRATIAGRDAAGPRSTGPSLAQNALTAATKARLVLSPSRSTSAARGSSIAAHTAASANRSGTTACAGCGVGRAAGDVDFVCSTRAASIDAHAVQSGAGPSSDDTQEGAAPQRAHNSFRWGVVMPNR